MLKRILILFLVLVAACAPLFILNLAYAQGELKFRDLEVDLWPEYDRPSTLVIYRITLPSNVTLPAQITLRIPASVGDPNAVAVKQANGNLISLNYTRQVNGDWALIQFTAPSPELQFEYYDPALNKQDGQRSFEYRWPGDYAIDSLAIQVQQPVEASEMKISPALGPGTEGQDGLIYYNKQIGSLKASDTFNISLNYQKSTDTLSTKNRPVEPSEPINETGALRSSLMAALPWLVGVLGVVLILGGLIWYWQSSKGEPRKEMRRRRKTVNTRETVPAEGYVYCHNCGKRAGPGDRFCRTCGAKLRLE
jgi:hypothetical protein